MAGAIVLPQQPSSMELFGQILKALGGMPGQIQAGTNAAATQAAQQQQQQNMQMFQKLLSDTMGKPNEVTTETVTPGFNGNIPQIDPNAEITEMPEGAGFAQPGMAGPQEVTNTTKANPDKVAGMKQLKELGPYFGVPKQGATIEELMALQGSKNEGAANVAGIRGDTAVDVASIRNKAATEIAKGNQEGKKESLAAKTAHDKEIEKILGKNADTNRMNAGTNQKRAAAYENIGNRNAATAEKNASTSADRASTYKDAVVSQVEHALNRVDAFRERTEMMKDALGTREVTAKSNVLSKMSKQLTQINKIKTLDLTDKDNQALLTQATATYEQLRQSLGEIDQDTLDQVPSLDVVNERGSTGIGDLLKQAFAGTFAGTSAAPGIASNPTPPTDKLTKPVAKPTAGAKPAATGGGAPEGATQTIAGKTYKKVGGKWQIVQ